MQSPQKDDPVRVLRDLVAFTAASTLRRAFVASSPELANLDLRARRLLAVRERPQATLPMVCQHAPVHVEWCEDCGHYHE